jgi:multiple sugar transport system permease protein
MTTTIESRPAAVLPGGVPGDKRGLSRRRTLTSYLYLSPALILMVGLMFIPIGTVLYYSFINYAIVNRPGRAKHLVGLGNYRQVFSDPYFVASIWHTLLFSVVSVALHLLLGLGFAMLLNSDAVGRVTKGLFRTLIILPWLFTITIVVALWRYLLFDPRGVVNFVLHAFGLPTQGLAWLGQTDTAMATVIFVNVWAGYPFFMISVLAGLQGVSGELREAARIDGANYRQQFWNVTRPHLQTIVISMSILDLIWNLQNFSTIFLLTGGGPVNSTNVLANYTYTTAYFDQDYTAASASAVVILAISLVLAVFYARSRRAANR